MENTAIQLLQMGGEVLVDSRAVAQGLGIQHEYFMETISTYQNELEEFGVFRFETGKPPEGTLGGRPQKYVLLNRNQAGVAISFSRNTKEVVRFKVGLFKAIDAMERYIAGQQERAVGLHQTEALEQLPPPIFKDSYEASLAPAHCPCPTRERVEAAIITTVQWLQPHRMIGVTGRILMMYNEEIQAYHSAYGPYGLLAVTGALVERGILACVKPDDGAYFYTIAPVKGYLPAPPALQS